MSPRRTPKPSPEPLARGRVQTRMAPDGTYLYRAFCRCGDLLYVGITSDIFMRMTGHRQVRAKWVEKMVALDWEYYRRRAEAELAEYHAIRNERPLYNKAHSLRGGHLVRLPWPRALTYEDKNRCAIAAYRGRTYLEWVFAEDGVAA